VKVMTADLISRARTGDGDAFRELTEPYRRELQVHCYRMLGSFADAEDALQDTLLAAWQGIGGFEGHASLRTWLFRIATNRCLNARRAASRRPAREWNIPGGRGLVARFCALLFGSGRRFDLVPARANGQPAFGAYVLGPDGIRHGTGLFVLTLAGERICAMSRFESSVLPWFGLPRSLPGR